VDGGCDGPPLGNPWIDQPYPFCGSWLGVIKGRQGVKMSANGLVSCIVGAVIISGVLIAGFYLLH
jgi:hypothetical protein